MQGCGPPDRRSNPYKECARSSTELEVSCCRARNAQLRTGWKSFQLCETIDESNLIRLFGGLLWTIAIAQRVEHGSSQVTGRFSRMSATPFSRGMQSGVSPSVQPSIPQECTNSVLGDAPQKCLCEGGGTGGGGGICFCDRGTSEWRPNFRDVGIQCVIGLPDTNCQV